MHSRPDPEPRSGSANAGQAARGTALNLVGAACTAVLSFVTVGVVTNTYGQVGAGLFFTATAYFTLSAQAARLGSEAGLTYFIARLRATGQQAEIRSLVWLALGATAVVSLVLSIAGFALAEPVADWLGDEPSSHRDLAIMIRILSAAIPAYALSQATFGATRGFATMRPSVISGQIVRPIAQLGLVAAVVVLSDEVWPLALAWAVAAFAGLLPAAWWLWRRLGRLIADPETFGVRRYWRFAAPRAMADLVSSLLERLDVILVALLISEAGAGLYGTSNRLILAGQMLMVASAQSVAPMLSASFARGSTDEARSVLQTVTGWNVVLLWPVFLCLAFGASTALSVFGAEFASAAPLVVVLSVGLVVVVGLGIGDTLLLMTGDSAASLVNHLIALAVMVGVSVATLPTIGVVGAAWAWAASRIVLRLLAMGRVYQTKGIHAIGRPMLTAGALAIGAYVPLGIVLYRLLEPGWATVFIHVGAGTVLHLAGVWRFATDLHLRLPTSLPVLNPKR